MGAVTVLSFVLNKKISPAETERDQNCIIGFNHFEFHAHASLQLFILLKMNPSI